MARKKQERALHLIGIVYQSKSQDGEYAVASIPQIDLCIGYPSTNPRDYRKEIKGETETSQGGLPALVREHMCDVIDISQRGGTVNFFMPGGEEDIELLNALFTGRYDFKRWKPITINLPQECSRLGNPIILDVYETRDYIRDHTRE
ncbi:MAG: hypothetical protein ACP5D2_00635 [Candidatus Nanoarchaeia archaeon]